MFWIPNAIETDRIYIYEVQKCRDVLPTKVDEWCQQLQDQMEFDTDFFGPMWHVNMMCLKNTIFILCAFYHTISK